MVPADIRGHHRRRIAMLDQVIALGRPGRRLVGATLLAAVVAGCSQAGAATSAPTAAASPTTATTQVMGKGTFHDVDGSATGEAQLVVKPDGAYELVLESFKIGSIDHTNLVLVSNTDVMATGDIDKTKLLDLGPLQGPEGMQDFVIPAAMASSVMDGYHSAVIWDTEMAHAIAAATLK
jgi:Electron transfer DM13